jgi:hypothetical protein
MKFWVMVYEAKIQLFVENCVGSGNFVNFSFF